MRSVSFAPRILVAESAVSPEATMKLRRVGFCIAPILAIRLRSEKALLILERRAGADSGVALLFLLLLLLPLLRLFLRFFDGFADFRYCRNTRRLQRIFIGVPPNRRAIQRIASS